MVMFNNSIAMLSYHEGKQDFSSVVNLGANPGFSFLWWYLVADSKSIHLILIILDSAADERAHTGGD